MNTPCEIAEKETASLVDPNDNNLTWVFTIKDLSLLYGVTAIEIPLCEWNPNWFKHGLNKKLPTTSSCIHKTLPCFLTCDTPGTHQVFPKPFRNFQVVFFLCCCEYGTAKKSKVCDLERLTRVLEELPVPTEAWHRCCGGEEMSWPVGWFCYFCWISASSQSMSRLYWCNLLLLCLFLFAIRRYSSKSRSLVLFKKRCSNIIV